MQTTVLLARSAAINHGLIDAHGLGWTTTATDGPMAVVLLVSVPTHLAGEHTVVAELHDTDGDLIAGPMVGTNDIQPIRAEAQFTARPNPYSLDGRETTTLVVISWQEGELSLEPGGYAWHLVLDGNPRDITPFNVVDQHEPTREPHLLS